MHREWCVLRAPGMKGPVKACNAEVSPAKPEMAFSPYKCITFKMLKEVKHKKGSSVS